MRKKLTKSKSLCDKLIILLCLINLIWILFLNISNGFSFGSIITFIIFFVVIILYLLPNKKYLYKIKTYIKKHPNLIKYLSLILIFIGIVLRLSFLFMSSRYQPIEELSDTGVHWYGAQQIAQDGTLDQEIGEYEAIFPYLSSYTLTLSLFMKIFGCQYCAIIFSNLLFDLIAGYALYLLFKKIKNSHIGLLAMGLWLINPLEIIFCSLSLAIIVVNMFMNIAILLTYLLLAGKRTKIQTVGLSVALGGILALGNNLRPIFIVLLIATVIILLTNIISNRSKFLQPVISISLLLFSYFALNALIPNTYQYFNQYATNTKSSAGWSIFVGSNFETKGEWNREDSSYFFGSVLERNSGDVNLAQIDIMKDGAYRYLQIISHRQLIRHIVNKQKVLFADVDDAFYDFPKYTFHISEENTIIRTLKDCVTIYYIALIILSIRLFYRIYQNKRKINTFMMFLALAFIGMFYAFLLVEVMNRYVTPFFAFFVAFGMYEICSLLEKNDIINI